MKKKYVFMLSVVILLAGGLLSFCLYQYPVATSHDVVAYNRIAKELALHWMEFQDVPSDGEPELFSVVDSDDRILYRSSEEAVASSVEALAGGHPMLDVEVNGVVAGKVIFTTDPDRKVTAFQRAAIGGILSLSVLCVIIIGSFYACLMHSIVRPFQELERFAGEVAQGNLEFPLVMKRNNLFGAFTQSFDLLREQLLLAKEKEFKANRNQKELIASLSHDIKTPVTSIKLTSELLLAIEQEERLRTKIGMIYQKAEQIEELVNNLFHTTLHEMEHLAVTPCELYSQVLNRLIRLADYKGKVQTAPIPVCMILLDELRFSQVLSNLFTNSYKYADTDIQINVFMTDEYLKLIISDGGQSMSEEEMPLIFNQFYRGSNAQKESGSGLGLPICKKLIEQMQGDIYCTCSPEGFTSVVLLKLA